MGSVAGHAAAVGPAGTSPALMSSAAPAAASTSTALVPRASADLGRQQPPLQSVLQQLSFPLPHSREPPTALLDAMFSQPPLSHPLSQQPRDSQGSGSEHVSVRSEEDEEDGAEKDEDDSLEDDANGADGMDVDAVGASLTVRAEGSKDDMGVVRSDEVSEGAAVATIDSEGSEDLEFSSPEDRMGKRTLAQTLSSAFATYERTAKRRVRTPAVQPSSRGSIGDELPPYSCMHPAISLSPAPYCTPPLAARREHSCQEGARSTDGGRSLLGFPSRRQLYLCRHFPHRCRCSKYASLQR